MAPASPAASGPDRPDPHPGEPVLLEARGLGRRDPDSAGEWLYRGLSLRVGPGELVALQGPTGAGKTLLLRALAGLDPRDEGEVRIDGRPAREYPPTRRRAAVLYLHQSPALFPGPVDANLREPFEYGLRRDRPFPADRARRLLDAAGRGPGFPDRASEELSGGERQIVALVRALLTDPVVLLLDEPTAALDPGTTETVERLVESWLEPGTRRAVVWVTHDRAQALRIGRRRVRLEAGELAAVGGGRGSPPRAEAGEDPHRDGGR